MATPLDLYFQSDTNRLVGEISRYARIRGRLSALINKDILPEGIGYNYTAVISERSSPVGGAIWTDIETPDGTTNNCVPPVTDVEWATNLKNFIAAQALIRSDRICFVDAVRGYLFREQVANIQKNFADNIVDFWEDRDKEAFFINAGNKVIADAGMTTFTNTSDFGAVAPTSAATQSYLDQIYVQLDQDGAGENAYGRANGAAQYTAIMSQEAHRNIIRENADVRQDIRFAEMGNGNKSQLLQSWNIDRSYGGFMHLIDDKMPRWDLVGGQWVRRPFYANQAANQGNASVVNPAYKYAKYEDIFIWHPDVITRMTPKAPHSLGSGTEFESIPYNGEVTWRNIPNGDVSQPEANPMGNWGRYWAQLQAAYKPNLTRYGYILRVKRCFNIQQNLCAGGY